MPVAGSLGDRRGQVRGALTLKIPGGGRLADKPADGQTGRRRTVCDRW